MSGPNRLPADVLNFLRRADKMLTDAEAAASEVAAGAAAAAAGAASAAAGAASAAAGVGPGRDSTKSLIVRASFIGAAMTSAPN